MTLRVLDLFAGIGGFSLGFERAGFETVGFCEIDPSCQAVLRKHWPNVPIWDDVRALPLEDLQDVDVITAGFPCQDVSEAGWRGGLRGSRTGLFYECIRIAGELRPSYVVLENVSGLLFSTKPWFGVVLQALAEIGFDAEWQLIPASSVGADHRRERVFVVAYPDSIVRKHCVQNRIFNEWPPLNLEIAHKKTADSYHLHNAHREFLAGPEPSSGDGYDALSDGMDRLPYIGEQLAMLGNAVLPSIAEGIALLIQAYDERQRVA